MPASMEAVSPKASANLANHRNGIYVVNHLPESYHEIAALIIQLMLLSVKFGRNKGFICMYSASLM